MRLVYGDLNTGRVVRVAEFMPTVCPAELPNLVWHIFPESSLPAGFENNPRQWEMKVNRTFWPMADELNDELTAQFDLLNAKADCLEQLSRIINYIRMTRGTNMNGWNNLVAMYNDDIKQYQETGVASSLLGSLASTPEDIPVGIAELQIRINTYNSTLVNTEIFLNTWSRAIKGSTEPYTVLAEMRRTLSSIN